MDDPALFQDFLKLLRLLEIREASLRAFAGQVATKTPVSGTLLRLVLLELGGGRVQRLSYYQRELRQIASRFAVRAEVHRLASMGILVLQDDPKDARAIRVMATTKLVSWYKKHVCHLASEAHSLFRDEATPAGNG